jgi:hypothetical protein
MLYHFILRTVVESTCLATSLEGSAWDSSLWLQGQEHNTKPMKTSPASNVAPCM